MKWTGSRATPSSSRATTMAAASEVCLVVISQDTSLETVLWIYLLLRTLSWCKVSPQLLDGDDSGDCVKSSSDAGVRTMFDPFFASVTCLALLFSGDVNTQNHTWTSGLPFLVNKIVFFVAFLWMRCLPPSLSLVVHIFRFSIFYTTGAIGVPDSGPEPLEICLLSPYRRQHGRTCNF